MISIGEARHFVFSRCPTLAPCEMAVGDAVGCVIAKAPIAIEAAPRFDNSAMDGYALRTQDVRFPLTRLRVVGEVMAGQNPATEVGPGETMRIMTGAPIPVGADAVCMVEHTQLDVAGEVVTIMQTVVEGANIRRRAEETAPGDEVFAQLTVIGPLHVGVLKSLGIETICVYPRPRESHADVCKIYQASRVQTFRTNLQAAMPYCLAGLRLGMALAIIGMVVAEMEIQFTGPGYLLVFYSGQFALGKLVAVVLILGIIGLGNFGLLMLVQRRWYPWIATIGPGRSR